MPSARAVAIAAFISAATSSGVGSAAADVVSTGFSSAIGANPSPVPVMIANIAPIVRVATKLPTGVQDPMVRPKLAPAQRSTPDPVLIGACLRSFQRETQHSIQLARTSTRKRLGGQERI